MKVAVVSTADRCGATVATLLVALTTARSQTRTARLCYTGENNAIKRYCGKDSDAHDASCTISQVSKLLESHSIAPEALGDYCMPLAPGVDLMDAWDGSLTAEEVTSLLVFTFSRSMVDFVFCDVAHSIDDPVTQQVLDACDAIIIVSEPSKSSLSSVRELQLSKYWPKFTPCMLLVCPYNEEIASIDALAREAQFKKRNVCKLHYNPLLVKLCNEGKLTEVVQPILDKDPRVVELNNDMRECIQFLLSVQNAKLKWGGST